ncbi:hypothetical protein RJ640_027511 [Escallonia rubra]|uniref:Uncharacterized protein n=1 Tax=Escallonia rubra TaxID=112253 RepID=A0AA88R6F9_9ASTE|nr:hypothetical protein RJ640_027511 [Escallonia rubra]
MSRCFPYPPPGYEKKARPEDIDLLKKVNHFSLIFCVDKRGLGVWGVGTGEGKEEKMGFERAVKVVLHKEQYVKRLLLPCVLEKNRERKHKKEKRDKEKKEKGRSDGKHREKKERKEKSKEKKKDKEKDRDKDREKSSATDEKGVERKHEDHNGENLHPKEDERGKQKGNSTEERRAATQFESFDGDKFHRKEERGKEKISSSEEKKLVLPFQSHYGEKPLRTSPPVEETESSEFVLELCRRIRDEEEATGSQLAEGYTGTARKKDEGIEKFAVKDSGMLAEGKEKYNDKRVDRKMDGQRIRDGSKNGVVQNLGGVVENRVEGIPRSMDERRVEGKEKSKGREGDDKRGDKRKSKDREKDSQGKVKDREKEKKKEKAKEKSEHKTKDKDMMKDLNKNAPIALHNETAHLSQDCYSAAAEGNPKKRKDIEMNGFLHDSELRPNKLPRPTSHSLTENDKKLEPYQCSSPFTSDNQEAVNNLKVDKTCDSQRAANNFKVDSKERKLNGITATHPLPVSSSKPSSSTGNQASRKSPHPDTKYLSQVLSVPRMDEWSEFDDQDWLFSSKKSPVKKPDVDSVGVKQEVRVWAEALQIESVDVFALPYVIPY